ncbi:MAG: hypothetical protein BYD32DRAFT_87979 [Podila humilis]|nr:MAG: hypothetical protein BYD32DRAFT_87979 [Podila humilis]
MSPAFRIQLRSVILSLTGLAVFCGLIFRIVFGSSKEVGNTSNSVSLIELEKFKNTLIIVLFFLLVLSYHTKCLPGHQGPCIFAISLFLMAMQYVEVRSYQVTKKGLPDGCSQCQYLECTTKLVGCFFLRAHHYVSTMAATLALLELILPPIIKFYLDHKQSSDPQTNALEMVPPVIPLTPRHSFHSLNIDSCHPRDTLP